MKGRNYINLTLLIRNCGFTLVELAIVLFVVALLLGGLLAPLAVQVEQNERRETIKRVEEIRDAIYSHAITQSRLPCPDCRAGIPECEAMSPGNEPGDGLEDIADNGECESPVGNIPWVTLGVSGLDAWGRQFTYRVDTRFAEEPDNSINHWDDCPATPGVSFNLCAEGDIEVREDPDVANSWIARGIPAIIVSRGKEGEYRSVYEEANDGMDEIFVDRSISPEYDDILIWISPHQLRMTMLRAGLLP